MGSPSGRITKDELKHWFKNALLFTLPAILAFLIALQVSIPHGHLLPDSQDLVFAIGAFYSAILSALIGLIKTYMTSNSNVQKS